MSDAYDFEYLIQKIDEAAFSTEPFRHIYLEDFFSADHFADILASDEISAPPASTDRELIDGLIAKGFKPISFPGCVTDVDQYLTWRAGEATGGHHSATEGFGMALRLFDTRSPILDAINDFLASDQFNGAIARKFDIDFSECVVDGGIQKYLDGYEISPHPDIRKKAATFMVNINPSAASEGMDHHTHYMRFDAAHRYVQTFWEGNDSVDRAWVPWSWSETVKQQTRNNSIVLFAPSNDTLHGVKAKYDHLTTQRTQLYGNLWYREEKATASLEWDQLDLLSGAKARAAPKKSVSGAAAGMLPAPVPSVLRKALGRDRVGKRNI